MSNVFSKLCPLLDFFTDFRVQSLVVAKTVTSSLVTSSVFTKGTDFEWAVQFPAPDDRLQRKWSETEAGSMLFVALPRWEQRYVFFFSFELCHATSKQRNVTGKK